MTDSKLSFEAAHDLRAPLVNIAGFAGELGEVVQTMMALVGKHQEALPASFVADFTALQADDLAPCLNFLTQSIEQLDAEIRGLTPKPTRGEN